MAYATKSDLIDRFGMLELIQRTDRTNKPPTTVDDVVVDRALGDAAALIDGYLAKVVSLPLAAAPANLVKVSADIARYYLLGPAAGDKDSLPSRAYAEAVAWLRDVAAGRIRLEVAGDPPAPAPGDAGRVSGSAPLLTRDSLGGWS